MAVKHFVLLPFLHWAEPFANPAYSSTDPAGTKSPSKDTKPASSRAQKLSGSKSSASRFLKSISNKLGLISQPTVSPSPSCVDAACRGKHSRSRSQPEPTIAKSLGPVADTQRPASMDGSLAKHALHTGALHPWPAGYRTVPQGSAMRPAVGLDVDPMDFRKVSGHHPWDSPDPSAAELPGDNWNRAELDGSTRLDEYAWSSPPEISSYPYAYSDSSWHSSAPHAASYTMPAYTQRSQYSNSHVGNFQNGSVGNPSPSNPDESTLQLCAELGCTIATNMSIDYRPRSLLENQYGARPHEPSTPTRLTANVPQLSQVDEVRYAHSKTDLGQGQVSQEGSSQSNVPYDYHQLEGSKILQRPRRTRPLGFQNPQRLDSSLQNARFSASSDNQAAPEIQEQRCYYSPPASDHAHETYVNQKQTAFESPLPLPPPHTSEGGAISSSPTDSIASNRSSSSKTTLPTSAETSPITPPFSTNAHTQGTKTPCTSQCDICGTMFNGSSSDRSSNLKRHRKYKHGQQEKSKCPTDGCNKEYPRPDNLRKHRASKHGDVQLKRRNARRSGVASDRVRQTPSKG